MVFLLFENFLIFQVGGHYEIQTGYIHWMLFVNNFSCLLSMSNHCLGGMRKESNCVLGQ